MKKMSTTKSKTMLAAMLTMVFLFVGMLDSQAQTAAELGDRKASEIVENLISNSKFHSDQMSKAEQASADSEEAQTALYYRDVMRSFKNDGASLSSVMTSMLVVEGTTQPRFSYLTDAELAELNTQIGKIQTTQASMQEIDAFHTLLKNSKNN